MILVIDNYDSFVYNLVQYLGAQNQELRVFRNDAITLGEIEEMNPHAILISPGPCTPKEAGISVDILHHFKGEIPIMGVCLGHQSIGYAFGGDVIRADRLLHGKTSKIYHDGKNLFKGLESPFVATRYHSLIVKKETLPDCLEVTAWTEEDEIMGLRHKEYPIEGLQFHPESILTVAGKSLIKNFCEMWLPKP